jgi:hypothetical protein
MKLVGSDEASPIEDRIKEQTLLCFHNIDQVDTTPTANGTLGRHRLTVCRVRRYCG